MKTLSVSWPRGNRRFRQTVRGRFLRRLKRRDFLRLYMLVWLPFLWWVSFPYLPEVSRWVESNIALQGLGHVVIPESFIPKRSPQEKPELFHAWGACTLVAYIATWFFLFRPVQRLIREGPKATKRWRAEFEAAQTHSDALLANVPLDRSKDTSLAAKAWSELPRLAISYFLVGFHKATLSPKHLGAGAFGRATPATIERLCGHLLQELARCGGRPLFIRQPTGSNYEGELLAIWQVEETVQFFAHYELEQLGNEVRVTQKTGHNWWIPPGARWHPAHIGFDAARPITSRDFPYFYPPFSPALRITAFAAVSLVSLGAPPVGLLAYAGLLALEVRKRWPREFLWWHSTSTGDSLDATLIQYERAHRYNFSHHAHVVNLLRRGARDRFYPAIEEKLEAFHQVVSGAMTLAIEQAASASLQRVR